MEEGLFILLGKLKGFINPEMQSLKDQGLIKLMGHMKHPNMQSFNSDKIYASSFRHISEIPNINGSPLSKSANREQHIKLMLNVNPFSEQITTRNESGLLQVIKQYREQDPFASKRGYGF